MSWDANAWFTQAAASLSMPQSALRGSLSSAFLSLPQRVRSWPRTPRSMRQKRGKKLYIKPRLHALMPLLGFVLTRLRTAPALYSHPWANAVTPFRFLVLSLLSSWRVRRRESGEDNHYVSGNNHRAYIYTINPKPHN